MTDDNLITTEDAAEERAPEQAEASAAAQEAGQAASVPDTGVTGPQEVVAVSSSEESSAAESQEPADAEGGSTEPVAEEPVAPSAEPEPSMETAADYASSFPRLSEGDVVRGVVVHIDREGVLVDVGAKSEGLVRSSELSRDATAQAESVVSVGDEIDVYVMEADSQDGRLLLSKKRADFEKAWERVLEAKEQGKTITAMVTERVKGGLVVDLGIRGFVPASHVGTGSLKTNLDKYVGQSIPLKVIEVDKDRRKVVLSNKLAADEDRQTRKAETIASLEVGQQRRGVVRRLTNYGAFVDLGGIDGLLHISEMSWTRINHPQEVLREGQEIEVVILKMDLNAGRISLGMRQILPDPWAGIGEHYHVGDVVDCVVSRIVPFGAFVQLPEGIEGIVPNAEMGTRKGKGEALRPGSKVEAKITELRPDERKMTLSIRHLQREEETRRERQVVEEYQTRPEREEPRFTIGDALRAKEDHGEDE